MQNKLQELTEKIYQEGVNKAKEEAEKILAEAADKAKKTIADAEKKAKDIVADAEKNASELKENSLKELQLAARQAISDIKQQIADLIQTESVTPEVQGVMSGEPFVAGIIQEIVKNWNPKNADPINLELVLPKNRKIEFEKYFHSKAKEVLNGNITINFSNKLKAGFKIGPKDGGYLISFSDDDFDIFFKAYLRPRLIEILYEPDKK